MPSPRISFRLSKYQLARCIKILTSLEPNLPITSPSQLIKTIIIDWAAKHSLGKLDEITYQDLAIVDNMINSSHSRMTLSEFQQILTKTTATKAIQESLNIPSKQDIEALQQAQWDALQKETQQQQTKPLQQPITQTEEQIEEQINEQIALAQQYSINNPEPTPQTEQPSSPSTQPTSTNPLTSDQPTESTINTVTDFSPPSDLLDQSE